MTAMFPVKNAKGKIVSADNYLDHIIKNSEKLCKGVFSKKIAIIYVLLNVVFLIFGVWLGFKLFGV